MRGNSPVSPSLTALRPPCHLRLAAASSHASRTACHRCVPGSLAELVQPLGMCSRSHTKRGPEKPALVFLASAPNTVPELVTYPSSLMRKCWQAVSESSRCWPCTPWLSAHSSGEQLCRGCSAGEEIHLSCGPCSQWVQLCPGEGGCCAGWPMGAGEVCEDRTEGCLQVKGKAETKMGCASRCSVAL